MRLHFNESAPQSHSGLGLYNLPGNPSFMTINTLKSNSGHIGIAAKPLEVCQKTAAIYGTAVDAVLLKAQPCHLYLRCCRVPLAFLGC